jgi:single-strand DNA-binding protein
MLNNVSLMGRLTRDPELRQTQSGKSVASFTLACNRDYSSNGQSEADFIDIVAWGKTGEFAAKYYRKGLLVAVQGRIQSRKWQDNDGKNRVSIEVVAERLHFAESKNKTEPAPQQTAPSYQQPALPDTFAELDDDDGELPF